MINDIILYIMAGLMLLSWPLQILFDWFGDDDDD